MRASRATKPISSRISGAYSGATFSPRQARIIFRSSSSPGSVMTGFGVPSAKSLTHSRPDFGLDLSGTPASGSGMRRMSRLGK